MQTPTNDIRSNAAPLMDLDIAEQELLASAEINLSQHAHAQKIQQEYTQQYQKAADDFKHLESFQNTYSWFDSMRLFTVRVMHILSDINGIPGINLTVLPLAILGLAYVLRFSIDASQVVYEASFPTDAQADKTFWQRFKDSLSMNGRHKRMANDFVWAFVNLFSSVLAPVSYGASTFIPKAISTAGYVFDIGNDHRDSGKIARYDSIIRKIDNKVTDLTTKINNNINALASIKKRITNDIDLELATEKSKLEPSQLAAFNTKRENLIMKKVTPIQIHPIQNEYFQDREALLHIKEQVQAAKTVYKKELYKKVAATVAIAAGMALFFFCPPAAAAIAGAALALIAGSIIYGFGKKIRDKYYENKKAAEIQLVEPKALPAPTVDKAIDSTKVINKNLSKDTVASKDEKVTNNTVTEASANKSVTKDAVTEVSTTENVANDTANEVSINAPSTTISPASSTRSSPSTMKDSLGRSLSFSSIIDNVSPASFTKFSPSTTTNSLTRSQSFSSKSGGYSPQFLTSINKESKKVVVERPRAKSITSLVTCR